MSIGVLAQVHELGRGQFGRVYLARWRGVEVAVKQLHRGNSAQVGPPTQCTPDGGLVSRGLPQSCHISATSAGDESVHTLDAGACRHAR